MVLTPPMAGQEHACTGVTGNAQYAVNCHDVIPPPVRFVFVLALEVTCKDLGDIEVSDEVRTVASVWLPSRIAPQDYPQASLPCGR